MRDLALGIDGTGQTHLGRVRHAWVTNIAHGLRVSSKARTATQHYRCRAATELGVPDGTAALPRSRLHQEEVEEIDNPVENEEESARKAAEETIELLRDENALDDLLDRTENDRKIDEFHQSTLHALESIMDLHLPEDAVAEPLLLTEASNILSYRDNITDYKNNETLIKALKVDVPLQEIVIDEKEPAEIGSKSMEIDSNSTESRIEDGLNEGQRSVFDVCASYFHRQAEFKQGTAPKPTPFRILVHGPGGTGKSVLTSRIQKQAEASGLSIACTAYTGSAVGNLPRGISRTMHSMFKFSTYPKLAIKDYLSCPVDKVLADLRSRFDLNTLSLLVIDEISCITASFLGRIEKRLREIMGKDEPFGGLSVLLLGDFFQLPPVAGISLYTSVIDLLVMGAKTLDNENCINGPATQGAHWFSTFRKMELTQQMRAAGDPQHMAFLNLLRSPNPNMNLIIDILSKRYKTITAQDIIDDPQFAETPIVVTGNLERSNINSFQSAKFAQRHKTPRFSWKKTLVGKIGLGLVQRNREFVYERYPQFTSYFVAGAPGYLIENICVSRTLANGTPIIYHSLTLDPREDREHILELLTNPHQYQDIELQFPPLYINGIVPDASAEDFAGFSLVPNEIVIPIGISKKTIVNKVYTLGRPARMEVSSNQHNIDLKFAITMHKIQGETCKRIILDLNERPFPPPITLEGLYVMCSRVPNGNSLRLMPLQPHQDGFQHLKSLKRNPDLMAWLNAFDPHTGILNIP